MKVYGYIIATNGLGHAYMMLLYSAIAEMKVALSAVSISLATSTDSKSEDRPGTTHERDGQTERSIPIPISGGNAATESYMESSTQSSMLSSMFSSIFSSMQSSTQSSMQSSMFSTQSSMQSARLKAIETWLEAFKANPNNEEPEDMISETSFQRTVPEELASQHKLAKAYLEKGRIQEAIQILEFVVKIRGGLLGDNHVAYLESKHELAVAYIQNRQATEAITLLKQVVAVEEEVLDKSPLERATSQHELGRAYLGNGQIAEAIEILEHVVAVKMSTLDESDPQLLASQMVLAEAHLRAGQASNAVDLLKHVISTATGTSIEHKNLRAHSMQWLNIATRQLGELAGGDSKPLSVFVRPKK